MTPPWDDLTARSRGLGTHLLPRAELEALARISDPAALAAALRRAGVLTTAEREVPGWADLEAGVRHWAASLLAILARWAGPRSAALPLVYDDEDRRSLRAITRGAMEHAAPERRLAGLIPTPALPERALQTLAALSSVTRIAALLAAWRHPYAAALAPFTAAVDVDLFAVELALDRAAAAAAVRAARRARHRALRDLVAADIDLRNVVTALVVAGGGHDTSPDACFLPGGHRIDAERFHRAATAPDASAAAAILATAFDAPAAALLRAGGGDAVVTEREMRRRQLDALRRAVRRQPLGPSSVVWFALRLRAQVIDLDRIIWSAALGAPSTRVTDRLLTVSA